jgi:Domain of unknown function (DUF4419)
MPITLNLCNTTSVGFDTSTRVDAGGPNELFVSEAMQKTRDAQTQVKTAPKARPFERVTTPNVASQRPTASVATEYSETLLAHQLGTSRDTESIYQRSSGLIHTLEAAYSNHRHLVLRPDDVWHTVLTQFSIYVNQNSESLRDSFVSHQGEKMSVIVSYWPRDRVSEMLLTM